MRLIQQAEEFWRHGPEFSESIVSLVGRETTVDSIIREVPNKAHLNYIQQDKDGAIVYLKKPSRKREEYKVSSESAKSRALAEPFNLFPLKSLSEKSH